MTTSLTTVTAISRAVLAAKTLEDASTLHSRLAGIAKVLGKEHHDPELLMDATEWRIRLEHSMGGMLREVERDPGGRPEKNSFDDRTSLQHAIEAGHLKQNAAYRYQVMNHCSLDDMEAHFAECRAQRKDNVVKLATSKEIHGLGEQEMNQDIPVFREDKKARNRISVPDGETVESMCRHGMQLEIEGKSSEEAATVLKIDHHIYQKMRDIVLLSDVKYLTPRDRTMIVAALSDMNEHRRISNHHKAINHIVEHMWGKERRGCSREQLVRRKLEAFDHACEAIKTICGTVDHIEVPYLNEDQLRDIRTGLTKAISNVSKFRKRIQKLHR